MDARSARGAAVLAVALVILGSGAGYKTANFIVMAPTPELAEKIGRMAEQYRHTLAIAWTGKPMPDWSQPCPITAKVSPRLGAGGETSFVFDRNEVYGWTMKIQGTEERVLDSVLPHEVTHTIFASYYRQPMPRWADEGACTTVEHESERSKQHKMLDEFLRTERGIPFSQMFVMKQYPQDILPLYAQGYSLARFFIQQGGRHKFIAFLGQGMRNDQWATAVRDHYGFNSLGELQNSWLKWVGQGSPTLASAGEDSREGPPTEVNRPDRNTTTLVARNQSPDNATAGIAPTAPVQPVSNNAPVAQPPAPAGPRELTPLVASATPVMSLEQLPPAEAGIQLPPVGQNSGSFAENNFSQPRNVEQQSAAQGPQTARGRSIYERSAVDNRNSLPLGQSSTAAASGPGSLNPASPSRGTPVLPASFSPNSSRNQAAPNSASLVLPANQSANLANVAQSNFGQSSEGQQRVLVQWGEPSEALDVKW